tara:strand:- start:4963 stop:5292 length:330 start_codon:yes stop_codon:yes gene_type:complete
MKQILEHKFCFPSIYEKDQGIECKVIDKEYLSQLGTEDSVSFESIVPKEVRKIVLEMSAYIGVILPNGETGLVERGQFARNNGSLQLPIGTTIATHNNRVVGLPMVTGG